MRTKFILSLSIMLLWQLTCLAWGKTGHRIVGQIAEAHLSKKAKKNIAVVLDGESLAEVSNYMDFIKSDDKYDHMSPWHYATIPDSTTYNGPPEEGDVIDTIERMVSELKNKSFTDEDEAFALKCLVHLVGDIHQPLHVGNGLDRGGNDFKVEYFWKSSSLHRVWDTGIIDGQGYSYTEYAEWIDRTSNSQIKTWQEDDVLEWAMESVNYRNQIYEVGESREIGYRYDYDHLQLLNQRLLQAGIRLAGILNEIYG